MYRMWVRVFDGETYYMREIATSPVNVNIVVANALDLTFARAFLLAVF